MDQLKKTMRVLLAHRFWIICGVVILVPLGGWFTTTAAMRKTTNDRKTLINTKFKDAKDVALKPDHPNETSHNGMEEKSKKLKEEIRDAWQVRYTEQVKLLVWPDPLGDEFKRSVQKLNPIERVKFPTPPADEIHIRLRERYRDYIELELPKLAAIIDAQWSAQEQSGATGDGFSGPAGFPGGGTMPGGGATGATGEKIDTSKVLWDSQDQDALKARYNWDQTSDRAPKTLDVLYAQEDLWLMTALMNIIAETNQGATARYNAVVKEISYINLGSAVGGSAGQVMRVAGSGNGMGGDLGGGGMPSMPGGGMPFGSGGAPGAGAMGSSAGSGSTGMPTLGAGDAGGIPGMGVGMGGGYSPDPANLRYVDRDYKPIPAKTVRDAIESDAQNVDEAYLLVAKRIPIRLGITIDQRKLHRFITACGNSKLMVEVRQVRFNRQSGSSGGGGMGGGMMGGGMPGMPGAMGAGGMQGGAGLSSAGGRGGDDGGGMAPGGGMPSFGGGGGYGGMPSGDGTQPKDTSAHDKPVEIYGVVYIYNPVDVKKLQFEEAAAAPATEPAAPPSAPAADAGAGNAPATQPAQPTTGQGTGK